MHEDRLVRLLAKRFVPLTLEQRDRCLETLRRRAADLVQMIDDHVPDLLIVPQIIMLYRDAIVLSPRDWLAEEAMESWKDMRRYHGLCPQCQRELDPPSALLCATCEEEIQEFVDRRDAEIDQSEED